MNRIERLLYLLDKNGFGLEFGPSHRPIAPKRNGYKVHIVDHIDKQGLLNKYSGHNVNLDAIEDVDYVWAGEPLSQLIGSTSAYDWVIASHVLEHIPNPVLFLAECNRLLKNGGIVSLALPDKRYCFDHLSPISTTGQLIDAFVNDSKRPTPGQVFDHFSSSCKIDGKITWPPGSVGAISLIHSFNQAIQLTDKVIKSSDYVDSHCWRFTPESFRLIVLDLNTLGLIDFDIVYLEADRHEIFAKLKKSGTGWGAAENGSRIDSLIIRASEY